MRRKVLCFILAFALVIGLAPIGVLAEDNGNGYENGNGYYNNDNGYENGNDYENGNGDENGAEDANGNGNEPQVWTFGLGDRISEQGENGWFFMIDHESFEESQELVNNPEVCLWFLAGGWGGDPWREAPRWMPPSTEEPSWFTFDDEDGLIIPEDYTAVILWQAPFDGTFDVTALVAAGINPQHAAYAGEDMGVQVSMHHNAEILEYKSFDEVTDTDNPVEWAHAVEMLEGEFLSFVVLPFYLPHAILEITISYGEVADEPADDLDEDYNDEDEDYDDEDEDYNDEDEDEEVVVESPMAGVAVRVVGGVEFVWLREVVQAYGLEDYLSWDSANRRAFLEAPELSFVLVVGENNSFLEANRVYVPLAVALELFEG